MNTTDEVQPYTIFSKNGRILLALHSLVDSLIEHIGAYLNGTGCECESFEVPILKTEPFVLLILSLEKTSQTFTFISSWQSSLSLHIFLFACAFLFVCVKYVQFDLLLIWIVIKKLKQIVSHDVSPATNSNNAGRNLTPCTHTFAVQNCNFAAWELRGCPPGTKKKTQKSL